MLRTTLGSAPIAIAIALTFGSCSSPPVSMRTKMQSWATQQNFVSDDASIRSDLVGIDAGIRLRDLAGLRTDCVGLSADADQIYSTLPSPDVTVTNELNVAFTKYWGPGAQLCYGARSFSSAKMATFERYLVLGRAIYAKAESRIASYGVH
ncbi:MAG TPA: hypothetical protein VMU99_03590 [Acidimicrobiales bacterium]|nr:hypothetical protein [Acidimicrobiales bacterium]